MTPAEVDRYTRRRRLQPLGYRYDRYDRYSTVTPSTNQSPGHFPYVLRIYGFTDLPPIPPPLLGHPVHAEPRIKSPPARRGAGFLMRDC